MVKTFRDIILETRKDISEVSAEEARELQSDRPEVVLLDVRERDEVEQGKIKGAMWVPRGFLELKIEQMVPDRDRTIVVYCAGGVRSALAAKSLAAMGYKKVFSMRGGFGAWKEEDFPFEQETGLSADQMKRYSRQILLKEVGEEGQRKLLASRVLIVGAGGLGCPAALYLAAGGVGTIGIVDGDIVDASNLHRQILHATGSVGRKKVESAATTISAINPEVKVVPIHGRLTSQNAMEILDGYDLVLDGSDNFPTKYLVNDASFFAGKPNVYGSIFQFEGQVSVFAPSSGGPCYRCLFPEPPPPALAPNCDEAGVLGVLPGTVGLLQALETLKLLLGIGEPLIGRMILFDALEASFRTVKVQRDPSCRLCGQRSIKALVDYEQFCGARRS